jgi:hypothetical protein
MDPILLVTFFISLLIQLTNMLCSPDDAYSLSKSPPVCEALHYHESRLRFNFPQRRIVPVEFSKLLVEVSDKYLALIMFLTQDKNSKPHKKMGLNGTYQLVRADTLLLR